VHFYDLPPVVYKLELWRMGRKRTRMTPGISFSRPVLPMKGSSLISVSLEEVLAPLLMRQGLNSPRHKPSCASMIMALLCLRPCFAWMGALVVYKIFSICFELLSLRFSFPNMTHTVLISTHTTASHPRPHVVYTVQVTVDAKEFTTQKRYSEVHRAIFLLYL